MSIIWPWNVHDGIAVIPGLTPHQWVAQQVRERYGEDAKFAITKLEVDADTGEIDVAVRLAPYAQTIDMDISVASTYHPRRIPREH